MKAHQEERDSDKDPSRRRRSQWSSNRGLPEEKDDAFEDEARSVFDEPSRTPKIAKKMTEAYKRASGSKALSGFESNVGEEEVTVGGR